jgi:acetyltransferase-like isoleucine patch superfamily enzyme
MRLQGHRVVLVRMGNNVWLDAKVTLLKSVNTPSRAIGGANTVVTSVIPCSVVAVASPSRLGRTSSDA